jgi:hypothetical protein
VWGHCVLVPAIDDDIEFLTPLVTDGGDGPPTTGAVRQCMTL